MLHGIKVIGNTVLDQASIDRVVAPYIGKAASIASLDTIRRELTLLYIKRGYINSGFRIPRPECHKRRHPFSAIEGRVTGANVSGTKYFKPEYLRPGWNAG